MKGLYSGRVIISLKGQGQKITRTQTAKQAYDAIVKACGEILPNAHYFHVGKGIWREHNLARDKLRTGKYAVNKAEWAERPHKLDWHGIDDKQPGQPKGKKGVSKKLKQIKQVSIAPRFSLTGFKDPGTLKGRKSKNLPVKSKTLVTKTFQSKIKAKKKVDLKGALGKLQSKKPVGRKAKVKPDKGISFVFNGIPKMPQKATLKGNEIAVTGYEGSTPVFSYSLKLADVESAISHKDVYFLHTLVKRSIPNDVKAKYSGYSIDYAGAQAVEQVYSEYLKVLSTKKLHGVVKKESGTYEHFGKNLKKGKFKDDFANMKSNIIDALKEKYPGTLFMIAARGFYNNEADVYWSGEPSIMQVKKLGIGTGGWNGDITHDVFWHHLPAANMRFMINKVEHNKALKTKTRVGYTRKIGPSDWEAPKPVVKMPAKIPKEAPAAVPKKQIKGRNTKAPLQMHTPVYKTGTPKRKTYKGFLVSGETYPLRHQIKAIGGKWNSDEGGWIVPATVSTAKQVNALKKAKGVKVSAIKTEENVFRHMTEAERLDIRKAKADRKIERWGKKAGKMSQEATRREKAATDVLDNIPFGQPILVGHYTEKADRNRRNKAFNNLGKAADARKEAGDAIRKAQTLSHAMDRIESVEGLKGRILKLEKEFNHAKNKVTQAENDLEYAKKRRDATEIERQNNTIKYWKTRATELETDIASIKERIPVNAQTVQTAGINIAMLGGIKLKPLVGATSVTKRYHNKNLSGGNFAVEVRKGPAEVELQGYHNTDGIITSLRVGPLFGIGASVITKENYQSFEISRLAEIIKKALAAFKN